MKIILQPLDGWMDAKYSLKYNIIYMDMAKIRKTNHAWRRYVIAIFAHELVHWLQAKFTKTDEFLIYTKICGSPSPLPKTLIDSWEPLAIKVEKIILRFLFVKGIK